MMKLLISIFYLFLSLSVTQAAESQFQPSRGELELKATATATWMRFISVYDAGLYAPKAAKPESVLTTNMPLILEIVYLTAVKKSQLIEAADVALTRQHDVAYLALFKHDVDALHHHYVDVEEGDRFRINIDTNGLILLFNDKPVYHNSNLDFAYYYIGLWLAENPLSDTIRNDLLTWASDN